MRDCHERQHFLDAKQSCNFECLLHLHYFLKYEHAFISITNEIIRCVRHRMMLIEKLCDMESANVHIKVNVYIFLKFQDVTLRH